MHRADVIESLEDNRLRELGERLVAIERADLLMDRKRQYLKAWHRDRLLTEADVPWLTIPGAREEIAGLREGASPEQHQRIAVIEGFVTDLAMATRDGIPDFV